MRTSAGTASAKASNSACVTIGPVGLFGLQTRIARVRGVTAAAIAGRSWRESSVSGTWIGVAPATTASHGYASNERQAKMSSSPGPDVASASWARIDTLPAATWTERSSTPNRSARRLRSRPAVASG